MTAAAAGTPTVTAPNLESFLYHEADLLDLLAS